MKAKLFAALGAGALILAASQSAMAGVAIGLNLGVPAPVYVAPAPVYAAPAPAYYAPPPPPVVAYQPVAVPSVYIGWHGDRYWDGHSWWGRRDWYAHHRYY